MGSLDWNQLVRERDAWVSYNFPDDADNGRGSVLGCIEELGELAHHHLKEAQAIRGDTEFHQSEAKDAVGDLTVYLLGPMSRHNVRPYHDPVYRISSRVAYEQLLELAYHVGRLSFLHLSTPSPEKVGSAVSSIVHFLKRYCAAREWNYEQIVTDTWNHVKQRDWIKWPDTGFPPIPQEARWDEHSLE